MMHNHPQDVGVTHWKPGSGIIVRLGYGNSEIRLRYPTEPQAIGGKEDSPGTPPRSNASSQVWHPGLCFQCTPQRPIPLFTRRVNRPGTIAVRRVHIIS